MSILSGFKKVKRYVKESSGYNLLSQWTSSQSVEMDDGMNLEDKMKLKAPLASPNFTGTPKAPTAAAGTSTTQIATTKFVQNAVAASSVTPEDIGAAPYAIVQNGDFNDMTTPGLYTM